MPIEAPPKGKGEAQEGRAAESPTTQTVSLCITLQERLNNTTGALVYSASVRKREGADAEFLSTSVPHGLDLRAGIRAKTDGGKSDQTRFCSLFETRLYGGSEIAGQCGGFDEDWAQALALKRRVSKGERVAVTLPLSGFAAVHDGAPTDLKQYHEMRQKTVSAIARVAPRRSRKPCTRLIKGEPTTAATAATGACSASARSAVVYY